MERPKHTYLLVLERLRPGDVILTTGCDTVSRKIQRVAGDYSHAAIFTGFGLLESSYDEDFSGVRFTVPKALDLYMGRVDGLPATLWAIPDVTICRVYRFAPQTDDDAKKYEHLIDVDLWMKPDIVFQPYASPYALTDAWLEMLRLRRRWYAPILKNRAARAVAALLISRWTPNHMREGYFCSQLVALVYAKAGLAIFDSLRPMPADLVRALSTATPDPVIDRDAVKDLSPSILRPFVVGVHPRLLELARSAQAAQDTSYIGFILIESILDESVRQIESVGHDFLQRPDLDDEAKKEIASQLDRLKEAAKEVRKILRRHQRDAAPAGNAE